MSTKGTTLVNTRNLTTTATTTAQFNIYIYSKLVCKTAKKSKNWYKYAKDTYFLHKVTSGLKLELNELPSQYSRFTYPSSSKENEVISAEIMKLIKKCP